MIVTVEMTMSVNQLSRRLLVHNERRVPKSVFSNSFLSHIRVVFQHPENNWTRTIPAGQIVSDPASDDMTSELPRSPVVVVPQTRLDGPQDPLTRRPCRAEI